MADRFRERAIPRIYVALYGTRDLPALDADRALELGIAMAIAIAIAIAIAVVAGGGETAG